jgi:hypothetical protein
MIIHDDYDYNKRTTDEYETHLTVSTDKKSVLICSDYLNYIVAKFLKMLSIINDQTLLEIFEKHEIGLAYNDYLYRIDNEQELDQDYLAEEENGWWIGDKFSLFESREGSCLTWLYTECGKHYLTITPMYDKHFLDSDEASYNEFVSKYTVIEKIELTKQDIENLTELLRSFV